MTTLFHLAPLRLGPGSVIEPGNWGRLTDRMNGLVAPGNVSYVVLREMVFENIRLAHFPTKVSRLACCYALRGAADVDAYRSTNDAVRLQVLHEVEVVDASASTHIGCLGLLESFPIGVPILPLMRERAQAYWSSDMSNGGGAETLIASGLRVVRCLD